MSPQRILIADDDSSIRWVIAETAKKKKFEVDEAVNGADALEKVISKRYNLIFIDIRMPEMDGLTVIESAIKNLNPSRFIVMTAVKSPEPAAKAASLGVMEYITKPFDLEEIEAILDSVKHRDREKKKRTGGMEGEDGEYLKQVRIVGNSKPIIDLYRQIGKVAPTEITILITGERGTGKELVAKTIHELSHFSKGHFVPVNMAAIPKELVEAEIFGREKGAYTGSYTSKPGKIEGANEGSIFFDEIGDAPLHLQAKLLRFIQEKEYYRLGSNTQKHFRGRIIAATNQNLEDLVEQGSFRGDLFDRLNVFQIYIPPIRERKEDIPVLAEFFTWKYSTLLTDQEKKLSEEALDALAEYSWPGNVRELENHIMKVCINSKGKVITERDVSSFLGPGQKTVQYLEKMIQDLSFERLVETKIKSFVKNLGREIEWETDLWNLFVSQLERPLIKTIYNATNRNKMKTAKILGINRNTLHGRIEKLKIQEGKNPRKKKDKGGR